jgi:hypothetical protein
MVDAARWLIIVGVLLVVAGVYLRMGGAVPPLGHLPGDIVIRRDGMVIYIPITTMILLSLLFTLVAHVVSRVR